MPDFEELFKGKLYLAVLLKGRRWDRVKGFALGVRQESGEPRIYENFEAMAKAATV